MTREDARRLIERLLPEVWTETIFLSPQPQSNIAAITVFDAIRACCDPAMSEDEFNLIADEVQP